jgi:hypothetical protein
MAGANPVQPELLDRQPGDSIAATAGIGAVI